MDPAGSVLLLFSRYSVEITLFRWAGNSVPYWCFRGRAPVWLVGGPFPLVFLGFGFLPRLGSGSQSRSVPVVFAFYHAPQFPFGHLFFTLGPSAHFQLHVFSFPACFEFLAFLLQWVALVVPTSIFSFRCLGIVGNCTFTPVYLVLFHRCGVMAPRFHTQGPWATCGVKGKRMVLC